MIDSPILIEYYKQQFTEIYNLDTLDWRVALILFPTFGGFFGVLGYLNALNNINELLPLGFSAFRAFSVFLAFLAFYGMWTVSRNHVWFTIRIKIIEKIEEEMKVSGIWNAVVKESKLSIITGRRIPLFIIYSLLFYFSLTVVLVDAVTDWKCLNPVGIFWTFILSGICLAIHLSYLRRKLKKQSPKSADSQQKTSQSAKK
jgi:hypothetical protein